MSGLRARKEALKCPVCEKHLGMSALDREAEAAQAAPAPIPSITPIPPPASEPVPKKELIALGESSEPENQSPREKSESSNLTNLKRLGADDNPSKKVRSASSSSSFSSPSQSSEEDSESQESSEVVREPTGRFRERDRLFPPCPICSKPIPKNQIEIHVELCLTRIGGAAEPSHGSSKKTRVAKKAKKTAVKAEPRKPSGPAPLPPIVQRPQEMAPLPTPKPLNVDSNKFQKPRPVFEFEGGLPTYYPTLKEFEDFESFMTSIDQDIVGYGGCKIVTPQEWRNRLQTTIPEQELPPILRQSTVKVDMGEGVTSVGAYLLTLSHATGAKVSDLQAIAPLNMRKPPTQEPELMRAYYTKVEERFWKELEAGWPADPPLYAADIPGSLLPKGVPWNMETLPSCLRFFPYHIQGVTTPYLYFGTWRALFGWHTEDQDLYSINYLHDGAPKQWYVLPPSSADDFECVLEGLYPLERGICQGFMRHKLCIVSPRLLESQGFPISRATQLPGEIVITSPRAYHAGFNHGFNCAEAVNFALDRWLEDRIPDSCKQCTCRTRETVRITTADLETMRQNLKRLRLPPLVAAQ